MKVTRKLPFRPTAGYCLTFVCTLALSACGGGGGGGSPAPTVTGGAQALALTPSNAAAALIQARLALELMPRVVVAANVLFSEYMNIANPCTSGTVSATLDSNDNPIQISASQCQDSVHPRLFNGDIQFDFSNRSDPLSTFVNFSDRSTITGGDVLMSLDGGLRLHSGSGDLAIIDGANTQAGLTVYPTTGPSATLGFTFHDFTSTFNFSTQNDNFPYTTLGGQGTVDLTGLVKGRISLSTPQLLTGPTRSAPYCYAGGEILLKGASGSSVQLDYSGSNATLTVNGTPVLSGGCDSVMSQILSSGTGPVPPIL